MRFLIGIILFICVHVHILCILKFIRIFIFEHSHCPAGDDAEVLKQLEDRTRSGRESLFRKKKELQRISTDLDEDNRRLELLRLQSMKIEKQKDHLQGTCKCAVWTQKELYVL